MEAVVSHVVCALKHVLLHIGAGATVARHKVPNVGGGDQASPGRDRDEGWLVLSAASVAAAGAVY